MAIEPTILRTERLVLRPWRLEDVDQNLENSNDPEFGRFLGALRYPYTRRDSELFVARQVTLDWEDHPAFAIEFEGQLAGDINVRIDHFDRIASIGYGIARRYWGQGIVTEAASAVIDWAFDVVGVEKIYATADAENVGSWRVMEKCGMQREAYFRSHRLLRGERRDVVQCGIVREDWLATWQ